MEITLSRELEEVVAQDMAAGRYATLEEYFADAVETLHERREWLGESLTEERSRLAKSVAQAKRGDLLDVDEVRRRMQSMKVRWFAAQRR